VSDGIPTANGLDFDTGITVSNGGLNAPLGDMGLYLGFLTGTGPGAMKGSYETVLARETLEEMWQLEVPIQDGAPLRESMGLTFFREEYEGALHIGHTGSQKAFFSFIYVDPATGAGAIAAFNAAGVGRPDTARPATRTILNQLRESFFAEIFPLFR